MKIDGYSVICLGSRNNHNKGNRSLKRVCWDCPLYDRGGMNTVNPTWRFKSLVINFQRKCKLKELYGKQEG